MATRLTGNVNPQFDPRITGSDPQSSVFITGEGATGNPYRQQNVANRNLDGAGQPGADPNWFQQILNNAQLMASNLFGAGQAPQGPLVTGDVSSVNPRITGSTVSENNTRVTGGNTGNSNSGGGGGGSSVPPMGAAAQPAPGGGGGGGGTPPPGGPPNNGGGGGPLGGLAGNYRLQRYGPGTAVAADQLLKGNYLQAATSLGSTAIAGKLMKGAAARVSNPIAKGALYAVGSLAAGELGNMAGGIANAGITALAGGAQSVAGGISNVQREGANVPFGGQATGLGALTNLDLKREQERALLQISNDYRQNQLNSQIAEKERDNSQIRTMQLNNQLGRLTTGLDQQKFAAQALDRQQSEGGANLRTMLTAANPYSNAILNYRG